MGTPPLPLPVSAAPSTRPGRSGFALTGRSRALDPLTHAVRPDIADVRLADRVFAPHYAAPLRRILVCDAVLRAERDPASAPLASLPAGAPFDLLDMTGGIAWGIAIDHDRVGYIDGAAVQPQ